MNDVSDREFVSTITWALTFWTPLGLANVMLVSLPTIERWRRGENLPAQAMRPNIVRFLQGDC